MGMAPIPGFGAGNVCIDSYEAARSNSTASSAGTSSTPVSIAGRVPWGGATIAQATAACSSVGKHLCTRAEWLAACQGNPVRVFPYGNTFNATTCFTSGSAGVHVTGDRAGCQGGFPGIFDLAGGLAEMNPETVTTGSGCTVAMPCQRISGSAYFQGEEESFCTSTTQFAGFAGHIGFRCCR